MNKKTSKKETDSTGDLETVRQVLEDADLSPETIEVYEDVTGYSVKFEDDVPQIQGLAFILGEEDRFIFYLNILRKVPEDIEQDVINFITRANYGISIGNFELDYSIPGVRYKSSIDYEGSELTPELIQNAVVAAIDSVEYYVDALVSVMDGKKSPEEALEDAES